MIRALRHLSGTQLFAIVVAIVVVVVVVFMIATGGFDIGGSDDSDDPLAVATEEPDDQAAAPAGDTSTEVTPTSARTQDDAFQFGDLRMAVTDIRLTSTVSEGRDTVVAIERFASVLLTARNTGDTPTSLAGRLRLRDGRGREYTPNSAATAAVALRDEERQDALAYELQPGLNVDLVVVFDVPDDAEDFRLRLLGGYVDVTLDR